MTQRALILAALSRGPVTIAGALECDDSRYLTDLLREIGATVHWNGDVALVDSTRGLRSKGTRVYCGNAGTTVRFGSCLALVVDGSIELDGDEQMRQRPLGALVQSLRTLGLDCTFLQREGCPPLRLQRGGRPVAETVEIESSLSSQYVSGLLLVSGRLPRGLRVILRGEVVSRPYLEMTVAMIERVGGRASFFDSQTIQVEPAEYQAERIEIEPDWSTAALILAAAEVLGVAVKIGGLVAVDQSLQGDASFGEMLVKRREAGPQCYDLRDTPDLIAPLAAIAAFAPGSTSIAGVAHARVKECDRIGVLCRELSRVGLKVVELADGLVIEPAALRSEQRVVLEPQNDHRMAMAFGIIASRVPGVDIAQRECVSKSYPGFWRLMDELRQAARERL
jgi:3-phosphoshikimate 1-carboxyvinyltransferase